MPVSRQSASISLANSCSSVLDRLPLVSIVTMSLPPLLLLTLDGKLMPLQAWRGFNLDHELSSGYVDFRKSLRRSTQSTSASSFALICFRMASPKLPPLATAFASVAPTVAVLRTASFSSYVSDSPRGFKFASWASQTSPTATGSSRLGAP